MNLSPVGTKPLNVLWDIKYGRETTRRQFPSGQRSTRVAGLYRLYGRSLRQWFVAAKNTSHMIGQTASLQELQVGEVNSFHP